MRTASTAKIRHPIYNRTAPIAEHHSSGSILPVLDYFVRLRIVVAGYGNVLVGSESVL
jgi:hypothetical protein